MFEKTANAARRARAVSPCQLGFVDLCFPGMRGFDGGVSVSPEGLEQGFRHGFSIDFDDAAARDAYLEHPEHKALGGQLVGLLDGGVAGLVVFDLVIETAA